MSYSLAEALKTARAQVGYREAGTNDTKFNRWLGKIPGYPHGGYGYPWCASFQSWVADRAGGRANTDYPRTAGCEVAVSWFKSQRRWSGTPHVGDWVFYGPGGGTHVELVAAVSGSSITTIGGNTSGSLDGRYFNGDGVYQKTVSRSSPRIYGYGRPNYSSSEEDDMPTAKEVAEAVWDHNVTASWVPKGGDTQWQAGTHLGVMHAHVRNVEKLLATQQATIDKLVDAVAAGGGVDVERLKQQIREAIESIQVRLDVPEE